MSKIIVFCVKNDIIGENMISARIKDLMNEKGWSLQQLADISDLPMETVRNVYYGKTNDPKISTVMKLAKAFNLSVNCLMGQCPHTPQERIILQNYRACGPHGKSLIEFIAKYEAGAIKSERNATEKHKIPCLVPHGDIHKGIVYETCQTIEVETSIPEAFVGIRMTNNDLAPAYCRDDIILFENRFPHDGERAAFFKNGRAYIREFVEEDKQYRLKCLHNHGEDILVKRMDEIEYIGTCIGVLAE